MPVPTGVSIGQELLNVPFAEMIRNMGLAIAEAQLELDMVGMRIAQMMAGQIQYSDDNGDDQQDNTTPLINFGDDQYTLLELGFTPTFYQFVETIIEVKMAISMRSEITSTSTTRNANITTPSIAGILGLSRQGRNMSVSSVNGSYSNKFQYSAEGSSLMRTKLVPVPAPAVLEERIRRLLPTDGEPEAP